MTTTITDKIFNASVERYDSEGWKFTPSIDFTGYTLVYMVKQNRNDNDSVAIISLTPELITEGALKKIVVVFDAETFKGINCGTYYHALKAYKDLNAVTIIKGKLSLEGEYIEAPVVEV